MTDGYIWLHKKLQDWEWYHDSKMVHIFIHLLLRANYKESQWQGEIIKRGQIVTGRQALSRQTGISQQSIRTCLARLKSTSEITIKSTNKYSIITLSNYEKYQNKNNQTNQQINQQTNHQSTSNQPRTKKEKKEKNIKKKINKRKKSPTPCPDIFPVTAQMKQYAASKNHYPDLDDLTEAFLIHHRKKDNRFVDWYAAWQQWFRNDIKFNGRADTRPMEERFKQ